MHVVVAAHDLYPDPGSGGSGRYVYETSRRLVERGHRVTVLTRRRGDVPRRGAVDGIAVYRYDLSIADRDAPAIARQLPDAVRAVRDALSPLGSDVLSLQGPVTGLLADELVDDDVPRTCVFHSPWPTEFRIRTRESRLGTWRRRANVALRRRLESRLLDRTDRIVTLSDFMRSRLRRVYGDHHSATVIPGGVDLDRYHPDADVDSSAARVEHGAGDGERDEGDGEHDGDDGECRARDGEYRAADGGHGAGNAVEGNAVDWVVDADDWTADADEGATTVLTVRRLSPRMGHGLLIEAFAALADRRDDVSLRIAGDGPLREDLESLARERGVDDRVTFLGYVPDEALPAVYANADVFALPTTELEGFGLATLEALASGTPVVGTPVGGTVEILADCEDALPVGEPMLLPDVAAAPMTEALARWASLSAAERVRAGRACRQYVSGQYSWARTVDALEATYVGQLDGDDGEVGNRRARRHREAVPEP